MNLLYQSDSHNPLKKRAYLVSLWIITLVLLGFIFAGCLSEMVKSWIKKEEYSHGFFIPVISLYLLWIRRWQLKFVEAFRESMPGLVIVIFGLIVSVLGGLAALKTVEQYAFIITVTGMFTVAFGMKGLHVGAVPVLFLIFMVPFPDFILNNLSAKLQLFSSWLGVEFIRACGIMVYLEGNVIDLGGYKLQVVDACSGLRYLFPLASLSFLCAYLFKGPVWQKSLIFLSSALLTILMNSFRIGVIGILVDHWGVEMAEGFVHDFEGWAVFMLCMALLFLEMWLFARLSGKNTALSDLVLIPSEWTGGAQQQSPKIIANPSVFVLLLLFSSTATASHFIREREDIIPTRKPFLNFPLRIGKWQGRNDYLSQFYLNELKMSDYLIINYTQPDSASAINLYSAYYQSQHTGVSVHSPKGCMPGDGWQINEFGQRKFPNLRLNGNALEVNRAVIQKGDSKQLVYYWFQQRGRILTNEYLVRWYLVYDATAINRTDGALVRLVTGVDKSEDVEMADQRLQSFIHELSPVLPAYLPG
ncbi:VPLPA-CTERM-specific exosortase XrtD [Methylomicrobium lacus]|uniref:VPLPA-CTERM-specific exosortase XrtD n=1 Tax=Methylomicrobium lacus TaxID=136992 RepID=UPI0035A8E06C